MTLSYPELIQQLWDSPEKKQAFLSNPKAYLEGEGEQIPDSMKVVAYEDTPTQVHVVIPAPGTEIPQEALQGNKIAQALEKASTDPAYKAKLSENPQAAASDLGIDVPEHIKIQVLENTPDKVNIVLPFNPATAELSDADLEAIAGGKDDTARTICYGGGGVNTVVCGIGTFITAGATGLVSLAGAGAIAATSAIGANT